MLISNELSQRNIRLITELELLGLLMYWIGTCIIGDKSLRLKESTTFIRISLYTK